MDKLVSPIAADKGVVERVAKPWGEQLVTGLDRETEAAQRARILGGVRRQLRPVLPGFAVAGGTLVATNLVEGLPVPREVGAVVDAVLARRDPDRMLRAWVPAVEGLADERDSGLGRRSVRMKLGTPGSADSDVAMFAVRSVGDLAGRLVSDGWVGADALPEVTVEADGEEVVLSIEAEDAEPSFWDIIDGSLGVLASFRLTGLQGPRSLISNVRMVASP